MKSSSCIFSNLEASAELFKDGNFDTTDCTATWKWGKWREPSDLLGEYCKERAKDHEIASASRTTLRRHHSALSFVRCGAIFCQDRALHCRVTTHAPIWVGVVFFSCRVVLLGSGRWCTIVTTQELFAIIIVYFHPLPSPVLLLAVTIMTPAATKTKNIHHYHDVYPKHRHVRLRN